MSFVGIIRYPGSNCDFDALNYFKYILGPDGTASFIWHKETEFPEGLKLLVIPGGFAFGDRLYDKATDTYTMSPGTMASISPVTKIIREAVKRKIPILGICNGFQILTQLGLLPGKLELNDCGKFICKEVICMCNFDTKEGGLNWYGRIWVANSYGRYTCDDYTYHRLKNNGQIFLEYDDIADERFFNYTGSTVAGICDKSRRIFGMMPHPERGNNGFGPVLRNILFSEPYEFNLQAQFQCKIREIMDSEHVSYKSTKKYLKEMYTEGDHVVQGPGENAGIVDIGNGYCIAVRIESHNHPTFIDPFEGAATGVGGILRDVFTMGARPIAILDFLRFGSHRVSEYKRDDAIKGISYYGNCIGVPNVGGDLYEHVSYENNPLVNVGCVKEWKI
jgi:phosphoribosylformylglycinamidine synthase I